MDIAKEVQDLSDNYGSVCEKLKVERKYSKSLREALQGVTDLYCELGDSGDAGFWNPREDKAIITANKLLKESQDG